MRSKPTKSNYRKSIASIARLLLCTAVFTFSSSLFTSCKQDDDTIVYQQQRRWVEKTVAVVAPIGNAADKTRLERTAQWFVANFNEAQLTDSLCVKLNLVWYDELTADLKDLSQRLSKDDNVVAIIGPFSNESVELFAPACKETHKPLILPAATSENLIRRYAVASAGSKETVNKQPFLWALTESDVAFTELLISNFASLAKKWDWGVTNTKPEAALFSPDNVYGESFFNWIPFQADNFDVVVNTNQRYNNSAKLQEEMLSFMNSLSSRKETVISAMLNTLCVVESAQLLYDVALMRRKWMISTPGIKEMFPAADPSDPLAAVNDQYWQNYEYLFRTMFAYGNISEEDISALGEKGARILQGYQGFSPYADPSTGFEISYKMKFGQMPTFSECKFYDALMLTAFTTFSIVHNDNEYAAEGKNIPSELFNSTIIDLTREDGEMVLLNGTWNTMPMRMYLQSLTSSKLYKFCGASGEISFDLENFTTTTHSAYVNWQIIDGKIVHRAYYGRSGKHLASSTAAWKYIYDENEAMKDFSEMASEQTADPDYLPLNAQYAVLVHGSSNFSNYRHLADVLNVYQLLRRYGFDDDHIILIADTQIPFDKDNKEPGIIRVSQGGYDLYGGTDAAVGYPKAVVDYDASKLTANDIADILAGRKSDRLPQVLPATGSAGATNNNVLLYWSGHGRSVEHGGSDELEWRDTQAGQGFTASLMGQTVRQMAFRKLLIITEPCYSENVIQSIVGVSGALAMSGASSTEQSWAENWNGNMGSYGGIWMANRFTLNVVNCITENPTVTFKDFYLYCTKNTIGSHVKLVNADKYGNLYRNSPDEFFLFQK